jgi:hypothetical protein
MTILAGGVSEVLFKTQDYLLKNYTRWSKEQNTLWRTVKMSTEKLKIKYIKQGFTVRSTVQCSSDRFSKGTRDRPGYRGRMITEMQSRSSDEEN